MYILGVSSRLSFVFCNQLKQRNRENERESHEGETLKMDRVIRRKEAEGLGNINSFLIHLFTRSKDAS